MELKIIKSPGKLMRKGLYYTDQLKEDLVVKVNSHFPRYLRKEYDISAQQYYNLVLHEDTNHKEFCNYCDSEVPFKSISKGYQDYCNQSCTTKHRLEKESSAGTNPFQNKDFIESNRAVISKSQSNRMKDGTHHFHSSKNKLSSARSRYTKYHKSTSIYKADIISDNSLIKIGLSIHPEVRYRSPYKGLRMKNPSILASGSSELLSNIEMKLKEDFGIDNSELYKESDLPEINKLINKMLDD